MLALNYVVIYCEVCGRPTERAYRVKIEGAVLVVCESCAERGEIIGEVTHGSIRPNEETYTDLKDDYGDIIKEARKRLKMDLRQLSRETGIPVKTLRLIEEYKVVPTAEQVRRLEKVLGVELREEAEKVEYRSDDFQLTLGDVVRIR